MKIPFFSSNKKSFQETVIKKDEEIGGTGTAIFEGQISNTDYVPELTGSNALVVYDKMRKSDGVIGAVLLACELPIRSATFYVEPASDDPQDQEIAEFVENNLFKGMTVTWDDFLRQILLMLPFGHMVFEKVFTEVEYKGNTYIGWKKFAPRLPTSIYKWETADHQPGITQILPDGSQPSIPIEKLLIFTYRKEGDNWLGTSLLRNAYRAWFFKQHIEKINAIAIERQGIGIPYAELPPNHTPLDVEKAKEILQNIRANEKAYLIKPNGWDIGFIDMRGNTVVNPVPTIARYDREIMLSTLTQFMDLGSNNVGSRALSTDQSTAFENNLQAIAKQICDTINNYAIKQLVDLNWDVKDYPTLKFTKIGRVDYDKFASALQSLASAGILTPSPELEDYVRDILGLPSKQDVLEQPSPETPQPDDKEDVKVAQEPKKFQEWHPPRALTFAENKVRWDDVHRTMEQSEKEIGVELRKILSNIQSDLIAQVQKILSTPDISEKRQRVLNLNVKYQSDYRQLVYRQLKKMFDYGKEIAAHEMHKPVPATPSDDLLNLSNRADALVDAMENDLIKVTKLAIIDVLEGKKFADEVPLTKALALIGKSIKDKIATLGDITPSIIVGGGVNQGRRVSMKAYYDDIYALQRSEILDDHTCSFCAAMDGKVLAKDDSLTNEDIFHPHCRGIWVEIMNDEFQKPQITGIPDSLRNSYNGLM